MASGSPRSSKKMRTKMANGQLSMNKAHEANMPKNRTFAPNERQTIPKPSGSSVQRSGITHAIHFIWL